MRVDHGLCVEYMEIDACFISSLTFKLPHQKSIYMVWETYNYKFVSPLSFSVMIINTHFKIFCIDLEISKSMENHVGYVTQIIGPVSDVALSPGKMPNIYNSLTVKGRNPAGISLCV